MSENAQEVEGMTDDEILAFTQATRRQLVAALTKEGKMPEDTKQQTTLLTTLADMDRAALGKKRVKVEEDATKTQAAMTGLVAHMLVNVRRGRGLNADGTPLPTAVPALERPAPALSDSIPEPELVPGETSASPMVMTWEDFQTSFGKPKDD
jgi:hypothetical protein